jgi:hypothetical protein
MLYMTTSKENFTNNQLNWWIIINRAERIGLLSAFCKTKQGLRKDPVYH